MTHEVATVGNFASDDHADRLVYVEDATVGVVDQQLGVDLFLCGKNDSVFALETDDGSEWRRKYSEL